MEKARHAARIIPRSIYNSIKAGVFMRNLKIGSRLNLVSLIALIGLAIVLALSLFRLDTVARDDISDRTRKTVEIAHSTVQHYQQLEIDGKMTRAQAQAAARDAVKSMRFGDDEYFWIIDMHANMVAHPMQPESEGKDLSELANADGKLLHKKVTDLVQAKGEGFVEYEWKSVGTSEAETKIAYVKGFTPWDWVIGTGASEAGVGAAVMASALSLGGTILLVLLAVGGFNWMLSRSISQPIGELMVRMRELADGNTRHEILGGDRGDEVGDMARSLEVFRENAIAKARVEAAKAEAEVAQSFVVETLSSQLARVSDGDLTAEITADFPESYAALKSNFNKAVGALHDLIAGLASSAHAIRSGADEIAQASDDLARRTESNAASLEQASAALSQMEERLRITATAAGRTAERASEATSIVGDGRATADEAVGAMVRVAGGAQGIDSVIEGLDKIAFQTQVLAMNAAVEAGRAGEAGRGFAVVADLVSALARRSEEEARRAREELTATQADIATAVDAVHKVDSALANIMDSVGEVHELVTTMARDNQAQSATISEITVAVGTMDTSTQQNAAMVEETSAATRNLVNEVAALSDSAARFKTGLAVPISKVAVVTPMASHLATPSRAPVAARYEADADDDWAEF
jgi:methyl-accepting chemotaxis protein